MYHQAANLANKLHQNQNACKEISKGKKQYFHTKCLTTEGQFGANITQDKKQLKK